MCGDAHFSPIYGSVVDGNTTTMKEPPDLNYRDQRVLQPEYSWMVLNEYADDSFTKNNYKISRKEYYQGGMVLDHFTVNTTLFGALDGYAYDHEMRYLPKATGKHYALGFRWNVNYFDKLLKANKAHVYNHNNARSHLDH